MNNTKYINPKLKEAVYVATTMVAFYQIAKYSKMEVGLALGLSTVVSQILLIKS